MAIPTSAVPTTAVLGTGLIGTSIALGLSEAGWSVYGWDPEPSAASVGFDRGAFVEVFDSLKDAVDIADLIVIASPGSAVPELLSQLEPDTAAMAITDVASVKVGIMQAANHLPQFVGGHPMAGREMSGPEPATGALFKGAAWVLVVEGETPTASVEMVELMIDTLGAYSVHIGATDHDAAVATISHLPHALAAALIGAAEDTPFALALASGSFRDLTRVALSEPNAWTDIVRTNRVAISDSIDDLMERLGDFKALIATDVAGDLTEQLSSARETRRGLAPHVGLVRVALADRPGELAKVGLALQDSKVDIRDLQLRHGEHGGGGILSLSIRIGEADVLTDALLAQGLEVIE
jgi:prephenate dehydrogenase